MARLRVTRSVDPATADLLLAPRDDVVGERPAPGDGEGDGTRRYVLGDGPFERYERTVTAVPDGDGGAATATATVTVTEDIDFRLPPATWRFLLTPAVRTALRRRPEARGRLPWWYPPQRPDARAATTLGMLATLSIVVGYHGTLLTQTMTYAASEFGASTAAQGNAFAAVRVGGLLAIVLGALADRRGRRAILTLALVLCIGSTVAGAAAPDLAVLAATQVVNRGAWAAAGVLLAIVAAEEMPAGARAYALSLLAMTGALGAGIALWLLPLADRGEGGWRLLYLASLLFVPLVARVAPRIPETRRFERVHRTLRLTGHYGRLVLLAVTSFLLNIFVAPQSQFLNEFLRDERGMRAPTISLFVVVTSTPAAIGIVAGGRLADTRGRRVVGATGIVVGTLLTALSFTVPGVWMWVTSAVGGIFAAMLIPTITVFGPELFPTALRGRANGIVTTTAMVGSVLGLVAAGHLRDSLGSFGRTIGLLAVAPLLAAVIILLVFPETARRELEDINPEDRTGPGPPAPAAAPIPPTARSGTTPSGG